MKTIKVLSVADLHSQMGLYLELGEAVKKHRPDLLVLVGDFLNDTISGNGKKMLTVEDCAAALAALPCPQVVFIRGNHEASNWLQFKEVWGTTERPMLFLNGSALVRGPLVMVGFPSLLGFYEDDDELVVSDEVGFWFPRILKDFGKAARTLWFMHEPPSGIPLSEKTGPISGWLQWRRAIEEFQPLLVVCGHDHNTPLKMNQWHCNVEDSIVVNVGQGHEKGLRYLEMNIGFDNSQPCLPEWIELMAWPSKERFTVKEWN